MREFRALHPVVAGVLLTFALMPGPAHAQELVAKWPTLEPTRLPTVYVRDTNGEEVKGTLLSLGADSLTLLVGGVERTMDLAVVDRIQRRDSLKNGAIAGAVVGVVLGSLAAAISDCPDHPGGGSCAGFRATMLPLAVGVYTGLGMAIDAAIPGRTTLYDASPRAAHQGLTSGRGRVAVRASLTW